MPLQRLAPRAEAYLLRFDDRLLDEVRASFARELADFLADPAQASLFAGGRQIRRPVGRHSPEYYIYSYNDYPLLWFSCNTAYTHGIYRRFFDALQLQDALREVLDIRRQAVMYCGFLVIGDRAPQPYWHQDYRPGAHALTLIAPLFELAPGHGHLWYRLDDERAAATDETIHTYTYRPGEAILLGAGFQHTTAPYAPQSVKRVLVSLTFGTDDFAHWPILQKAIKAQSRYYLLPCGHVAGSCQCELRYRYGELMRRLKG